MWLLRSLIALKQCLTASAINRPVVIQGDSELLLNQLNGIYHVKDAQLSFFKTVVTDLLKQLTKNAVKFVIQHIPREQNSSADLLANQAIDAARLTAESSETNSTTARATAASNTNTNPATAFFPNCFRCGQPASMKCARCRTALYCGKECQQSNWKSHKRMCVEPALNVLVRMVCEFQNCIYCVAI